MTGGSRNSRGKMERCGSVSHLTKISHLARHWDKWKSQRKENRERCPTRKLLAIGSAGCLLPHQSTTISTTGFLQIGPLQVDVRVSSEATMKQLLRQ